MNILLFGTNNYFKQIKTTIYSLVRNNKNTKFKFYLFLKLDNKNKEKIKKFISKNNSEYIFIDSFPDSFLSHFSINDHTQIFLNKFIFFCLPNEVERILYIDCDLVIAKDISNFYNQEFDGKSLIVTKDLILDYGPRVMPNGVSSSDYFNAGVLLLNIKKIKEVCSLDMISEYLNIYRGKLPCDDQDILNMIFLNDKKVMENRDYNYCVRHKDQKKDKHIKDAAIIHYYYQNNKPWKYSYYNRNGFKIYWKYAKHCFGYLEYIKHLIVYKLKIFRYYYLGLLHGKIRRSFKH